MTWEIPAFTMRGLELVRASIAPPREARKDHGPRWLIFGAPFSASDHVGVVIAGDYHQVLDGALLGCTAHFLVGRPDLHEISAEDADEAAATLGPWIREPLWDFMAGHLRSLAATSRFDFDIPRESPEPTYERLANRQHHASDRSGRPARSE